MCRSGLCVLILVCALVALPGASATATYRVDDATACEAAAVRAAHDTGVPLRLLRALAPVESGVAGGDRLPVPWPWTLNANGYGSYHFASRMAALRYLRTLLARGIDNVDIGCMQVNWHWQGRAFGSADAALTPILN